MLVYHATIKKSGDSIIRENKIKTTTLENSPYKNCSEILNTTEGFVYLSTTIEKAFDYGLRNYNNRKLNSEELLPEIYIFEATIEKKEALIDKDEEFFNDLDINLSKEEIIFKMGILRIKRNLNIGFDVTRYVNIEFKDGWRKLENMEKHGHDLLIKKLKWIELR